MEKTYSISITGSGNIYELKGMIEAGLDIMEDDIKPINLLTKGVTEGTQIHIIINEQYSQTDIDNQIEDAKRVLQKLGVPEYKINKICCLTFLALCSIVPDSKWKDATNKHMTLSNEIMKYVSENYNIVYKANSRESFRKEGINVLLNYEIIDLNPGNSNLGPTSPLTHYAIKENMLKKIQKM